MSGQMIMPEATEARPPRRSLIILAALLFASGALRMGDNAGRAWAEVAAAPAAGAPLPAEPASGNDPGPLVAALKEREAKLQERENALREREASLAEARALAETRIAELQAQEAELAKTLTIADDAAESDVARLVAVYETMKPKDAIPLFAVMDADFATGFLARMKPEPAAAILSGLDPKLAYTISAVLAGRNARAPQN